MVDADEMQNERLADLEKRMRLIENSIVELALVSRTLKYALVIMAASLGIDLQEMI